MDKKILVKIGEHHYFEQIKVNTEGSFVLRNPVSTSRLSEGGKFYTPKGITIKFT